MPELVTQYPDIALKLLKDAHINCGTGASQSILKTCPKNQFCSLPTGELCIYGVKQIPEMTQLNPINFIFIPSAIIPLSALMLMIFLVGFWCGVNLHRFDTHSGKKASKS